MNTSKADILDPIDGDHIRHFAKSKKILLSSKDNQQIDQALKNNKALKNLVGLVESFNGAFNAANQFPGLSNQEVEELKNIMAQLKELKANSLSKNTSTETIKEILALEKKLVTLDRTRQWWDLNLAALNKETVWNSLIELARTEFKKQNAIGDDTNAKLELLEQIKLEWDQSQLFSRLSSENLLLFYTDFICELEKCLLLQKKKHGSFPTAIQEYIEALLLSLQKLKSTAVYAMAYRLNCADYYQHIECDDLVAYTASKIQDTSGITVLHFDKAPPIRCTLNSYLFKSYTKIVREHKPYLKNLIHATHYKIPDEWNTFAADNPEFYPIIHNPIFIYFAHGFSLTPEEMPADHIISPLERQRILLNHAKNEYHLLKCIYKLKEPNPIHSLIEHENKKLNTPAMIKNNVSLLPEQSMIAYIQFISQDLFNKYLQATHLATNNLDYNTACLFYDLSLNVINDDVKLALTNAYKTQIAHNPYWLTLINHLGEKDTNSLLENQEEFSPEFNQLLTLSKQFHALKVAVKSNLQTALYNDAIKSKEIITLPLLKDTELIALWRSATKKLDPSQKTHHLYFVSKLVIAISDEIIHRAQTQPALLKDFTNELSKHRYKNSLWAPPLCITDKVKALQLILKIEHYKTAEKIEQHDLTLLLEQCHLVLNQKASLSSLKPMILAAEKKAPVKSQGQFLQKLLVIIDKNLLIKNDFCFSFASIKNIL